MQTGLLQGGEWIPVLAGRYCCAATAVGPLLLCSYFRMSLSRGKSITGKVRCALIWAELHAKVQLNSTGVEVRDFVSGLVVRNPSSLYWVKAAHQAPPFPVDVLIRLEGLVATAHTLPLRVYAGVVCLCAHGVKRWSDVQHVLSMPSTAGTNAVGGSAFGFWRF